MKLSEVNDKALEVTLSNEPGKGLWWSQCNATNAGNSFSADFTEAVNTRLIGKLPGIETEEAVQLADKRLHATCKKWNPSLTRDEVTQAMDSAVKQAMQEVATQHVGGKGSREQGR